MAVACPNATSGSVNIGGCTEQIIDTAGADRSWITSDGSHVYISYHDSGNSDLILIQRSDDDGFTWHRVGDPIVGKEGATGDATSFTRWRWIQSLARPTPPGLTAHTIAFSPSSDQGSHWSPAVTINLAPANTAVFPVNCVLTAAPLTWFTMRGPRPARRPHRRLECVCTKHRPRRQLRPEPREQYLESHWRDLHKRHCLCVGHAQSARLVSGRHRSTKLPRSDYLH